ncbi:MAG: hypothetical protein KKH98_13845, partial [Spirochaetes bacterium]|nr:hypothetical protein [Spirochaetota bacterium]
MKKKFISIIIILTAAVLSAQEEYDLGEKKVIGEDKREYRDDINIIKNTNSRQNKKEEEIELKLKDEKADIHDTDDTVSIKAKKEDLLTPGGKVKDQRNNMLFGAGGFNRIDSFHYSVDYTKEMPEKGLDYYLHINRFIRGEDRKNSDIDSDHYLGKVRYKRFSLSLSHKIKDDNLPGQKNAVDQVNSFKNEKTSELNSKFDILSDKRQNIDIGMDVYSQRVASLPTFRRNYKNNLYDLYLSWDILYQFAGLKNYTLVKAIYYRDNMPDEKNSCIKLDTVSKIKTVNDPTLSFDLKAGTEYLINDDKDKENNYNFLLGINKDLSREIFLGLSIQNEDVNKISKYLFSGFEFDDDILPFGALKNDNTFIAEITAGLNLKHIYLETKMRAHRSKDKIIYEEDHSFPGETAIHIINYDDTLRWQELEGHLSTKIKSFKGEVKYIYSDLKNIPFTPVHKFIFNLIFDFKRLTNRIEGKYYTEMVGLRNNNNVLPDYRTIDLYNTYKFSQNLFINLNMLNLFNSDSWKKTDYLIDQRKIML